MRLTKPLNIAPADQRAPELEERLVNVLPPLVVANLQPPVAIQPRERPFHHPPVASQPFARLDAPSGDARGGYAPLPERLAAAREVLALVGVQLVGALARSAARLADRLDSIYGLLQDFRVVDVGGRVGQRKRDASPVEHNMALGARFALIRRVRAGSLAPPGAGTLAESKEARSQSIWSASPKRSKSLRCSRSHTPTSCHSLKRRQQLMPEPQPICWGSISQGMPVLSTNRMPVRAARSSTRGLPPLGFLLWAWFSPRAVEARSLPIIRPSRVV